MTLRSTVAGAIRDRHRRTLVQGKLANGLAFDNPIRPLLADHGFGNYADRFVRDDTGYILTYDLSRIGFESSDGSALIQQLLNR